MIRFSAPSKINLFLNVFAERPDGYHELDTVFFPLRSPADRICLDFPEDRANGIVIHCKDPGVPADPGKNLCGRAVTAYCRAAEMPVPAVDIFLEKEIPCSGGMGGGSSDAASILLRLNERFHRLSPEALAETALSLGADVPFFLNPVPARAQGTGEKISPLPRLPGTLPLLLAAPDFPVSAKWAYEHWTPDAALPDGDAERLADALEKNDLPGAAQFIGNSLSAPLFRKFPLLRDLKDSFLKNGALCSEITGSGPTVFALFPDSAAADTALKTMTEACPSVRFLRGF